MLLTKKQAVYSSLLISTFTSLILAELFLRIFIPHTDLTWEFDPDLGKTLLTPNSQGLFVSPFREYFTQIESNLEGFRDINHNLQKPEGVYRIIFLGDSFVQNFQVPLHKTFFKIVENNLAQDKKVEVITIGLGNTGTAQQLIALKKFGLKYKPDLVVQLLFTGNDIKNNSPRLNHNPYIPYYIVNSAGGLQQLSPKPKVERPTDFIKNLRLVELLLAFRQKIQETLTFENYPLDYHVYDKTYTEDFENAWKLTERIILETKKVSEKNGSKYLLVSLANNEQVNQKLWSQVLKRYRDIYPEKLDLEKPDKLLRNFCQSNQLNCSFMLPYFQTFKNTNSGVLTHYRLDGHWTPTGTNLTAQFLVKEIRDRF